MVAFSSVKAGDRLWEKKRIKMGNTTMTKVVVYCVSVKEVNDTHVVASWNGNAYEKMYPARVEKMLRNKPVVK